MPKVNNVQFKKIVVLSSELEFHRSVFALLGERLIFSIAEIPQRRMELKEALSLAQTTGAFLEVTDAESRELVALMAFSIAAENIQKLIEKYNQHYVLGSQDIVALGENFICAAYDRLPSTEVWRVLQLHKARLGFTALGIGQDELSGVKFDGSFFPSVNAYSFSDAVAKASPALTCGTSDAEAKPVDLTQMSGKSLRRQAMLGAQKGAQQNVQELVVETSLDKTAVAAPALAVSTNRNSLWRRLCCCSKKSSVEPATITMVAERVMIESPLSVGSRK